MRMEKKSLIVGIVVVLLVGAGYGGYWYGNKEGVQKGYEAGYAKAEEDISKLQEEAVKKGVEETAKSANPFEVSNPLEGIETDPFEKVKKILNPVQ